MPRAYQWTSPLAAGTLVPGGPKKCSVCQEHVLLTTGVDWPLEKGGLAPGEVGLASWGNRQGSTWGGEPRGGWERLPQAPHSKWLPLQGNAFFTPLTHTRSHLLPPDPTSPNLVSLSACLPRLTLSA